MGNNSSYNAQYEPNTNRSNLSYFSNNNNGAEAPQMWNNIAAKAAIKSTHEKINLMIKENQRSVEDVRTALMIDVGAENRDGEEQALKKVAENEIEITQALAMLPYSSKMYRYKMNQLNSLAKKRKELERVILEQKLANQGPNPSKSNPEYDERKGRIRSELRKALGDAEDQDNAYDKKAGFDLHFDFVLDIPEPFQTSQISYGVYLGGRVIHPPALTQPHPIDGEQNDKDPDAELVSLYGEKATLLEIIAKDQVLIFFELQFANRLDKVQQSSSYGWTCLDPFTENNTLKEAGLNFRFILRQQIQV